jgi:predicted metal-dependent hydrolase
MVLAGETVEYCLIRARRRTIGMEVNLEGLTVRAPRWVTISEIESALAERAKWIVKALVEWRGRRRDVMPNVWKYGAPILYPGREMALEVFPSRRANVAPDLFLTVLRPHARGSGGTGRQMAERRSVELVAPQVIRYAQRYVHCPQCAFRTPAMGSCNARGKSPLGAWSSCRRAAGTSSRMKSRTC